MDLPLPCAGAHPRLRGEHMVGDYEDMTFTGSSPLTRGAQLAF